MTDSNNISTRQLARLLKKFHINDGDILALKYKTGLANEETIDLISKAFDRMGLNRTLIVVVDDFDDLKVLNETEMNRRGWYRMESLAKIVKLPKEKQ